MTLGQIAIYLNPEGKGEVDQVSGSIKNLKTEAECRIATKIMKAKAEHKKNGTLPLPRRYG
jgi:hypothetical protein